MAAAGDGDLREEVEANAEGPLRVTVDGTTVEQHSLKDQIEADRYLQSAAAVKRKKRGLFLTKLSPPGTV